MSRIARTSLGLSIWMGLAALPPTLMAAPPTEHGVYELRLQPSFDLIGKVKSTMSPVRVGLGQYLSPHTQIGGYISLMKSADDSYWGKSDVWGLGLYAETAFDWDRPFYPYAAISMGLIDGDSSSTAFVTTLSPGVKAFLLENLALSLQLDWNISNKPLYDFDRDYRFPDTVKGSGDRNGLSLSLAVRLLFF